MLQADRNHSVCYIRRCWVSHGRCLYLSLVYHGDVPHDIILLFLFIISQKCITFATIITYRYGNSNTESTSTVYITGTYPMIYCRLYITGTYPMIYTNPYITGTYPMIYASVCRWIPRFSICASAACTNHLEYTAEPTLLCSSRSSLDIRVLSNTFLFEL